MASQTYHIKIEDKDGTVLVDETQETFIYGRPQMKGSAQFSFLAKVDILKLAGPLVLQALTKNMGGS